MKKQNKFVKTILPIVCGVTLIASVGTAITVQSSYASKRKSLEIEAKEKEEESKKRARASMLGLFGSSDMVLRGDRRAYEHMIEKSKENERISDSLQVVSDSLKKESLKYEGPFYSLEKFFDKLF